MKADDPTRPCGDCETRVLEYDWCDTCSKFVCLTCGETHACIEKILAVKCHDTND
jgi:hypothetical protein